MQSRSEIGAAQHGNLLAKLLQQIIIHSYVYFPQRPAKRLRQRQHQQARLIAQMAGTSVIKKQLGRLTRIAKLHARAPRIR